MTGHKISKWCKTNEWLGIQYQYATSWTTEVVENKGLKSTSQPGIKWRIPYNITIKRKISYAVGHTK